MTLLPWNCIRMTVSAKKISMVINILRMMCIGHVLEAPWTIPAHMAAETWVKNCTARFYNHSIGMRSYFLKSKFKFNLQKHYFVYVYEVIIKCYLNFITSLYFPLALIRWNSSHCRPMELFKSNESCKKKFDSNNNWKTAWPRMILEWHIF